ncbi:MAG: helix-turn-helix transcriptional regulator [Candidatus Brocadiales bacterium]
MKTRVRYHKNRLKEDLKNSEFRKHYEKEKKALKIAYQIAKLRRKLGLSQKDFAKRVGTTQQVISRLESGTYTGYTLKTLERVAKATNTEIVISFRSMQVA